MRARNLDNDLRDRPNSHFQDRQAKPKVLILVLCSNAEATLESVLDHIPPGIWRHPEFSTEVLIIDDQSSDRTFRLARDWQQRHPKRKLTVLRNPKSQGYGGNQKIGYCYAIQRGFRAVVLLHGDGRCAPEYLGPLIRPILDGTADVVLGSRMPRRRDTGKARMPRPRWLGSPFLTRLHHRLRPAHLAELRSSYRAYSVPALASIPFAYNANDSDFDIDILIQLRDTGRHIMDVPIPIPGKESSRTKGIRYALHALRSCLLARVTRWGIYYHPKLDYRAPAHCPYQAKFGYASSHQFAFDQVTPHANVLDLGGGPGFLAEALLKKQVRTVSLDKAIYPQATAASWRYLTVDVEQYDFQDDFGKVDFILALDIIEHLKSPERLLQILRQRFSRDAPDVIITTANIAFLPLRLSLLWGAFNYGPRGILDMDHTRLFTFATLRRTLEMQGYQIRKQYGVPAPFPLALGDGRLARFLLRVNRGLIFLARNLFSYQVALVAKPLPTLEHLLEDACQGPNEERCRSRGRPRSPALSAEGV